MNDFKSLTDAFEELERRADAATAQLAADPILHRPVRHRGRPLLVAASAVTVLAVVGGGALLARGNGTTHHTQAGGGSLPPATQSAAYSSPAPAKFTIPTTPEDLANRFRTVLDGTATFTVTDTGTDNAATVPLRTTANGNQPVQSRSVAAPLGAQTGVAIVGTLTASGVTGGFDLQIYQAPRGEKAWCDSGVAGCRKSTLADGSTLALLREPLEGPANGVTYMVDLVRADGAEFLMHVSNERDPKGDSPVLAPNPPLTTDQMVAIVTSDRW